MKIYTENTQSILEAFSALKPDKWFLFLNIHNDGGILLENIKYSAPYLADWKTNEEHMYILHEERGVIEFDTEKECYEYYDQTVCDYPEAKDKVTSDNFIPVYACIYNSGVAITENT